MHEHSACVKDVDLSIAQPVLNFYVCMHERSRIAQPVVNQSELFQI